MVRVLDGLHVRPGRLRVHTRRRESLPDDSWQLFEEHGLRRPSVHRAAPSREPDRHAGLHEVRLRQHRGAWQDDLGGALYLDPTAPA